MQNKAARFYVGGWLFTNPNLNVNPTANAPKIIWLGWVALVINVYPTRQCHENLQFYIKWVAPQFIWKAYPTAGANQIKYLSEWLLSFKVYPTANEKQEKQIK